VCVCVCARVQLWRWLGKRCHMSYHYSAIPQTQELFDCPSYIYSNLDIKTCIRALNWITQGQCLQHLTSPTTPCEIKGISAKQWYNTWSKYCLE
jgi:hypothetical protein